MYRRIIVHEYVAPRGPLTNRECTVSQSLLEYLLGIELEEEQQNTLWIYLSTVCSLKCPKLGLI